MALILTSMRYSTVHQASGEGHLEHHGANPKVHASDVLLGTALHWAFDLGHSEVVFLHNGLGCIYPGCGSCSCTSCTAARCLPARDSLASASSSSSTAISLNNLRVGRLAQIRCAYSCFSFCRLLKAWKLRPKQRPPSPARNMNTISTRPQRSFDPAAARLPIAFVSPPRWLVSNTSLNAGRLRQFFV